MVPVMERLHGSSNLPEYSVKELSRRLRRTVENAFERVRVRGEISGYRRASSGHSYLSLKDADAVLNAIIWQSTAARLQIRPEDGLEVICEGRLTTYARRSSYQLSVESMTVAGEGALLALLEERRRKLAEEGLFDAARKSPIPYLPERIGVVTSASGVVIRDILHRIADRFPRPVLIWPVRVQGDGAAQEIAAAIAGFNALPRGGVAPRPDVLIVARGGGSVEDLWAFNEETVVRAAGGSRIPLISAVGHETDTTLIDYAADWRAPTPTAAAEKAVPVHSDLIAAVREHDTRLVSGFSRYCESRRAAIAGLVRGLPRPRALLEDAAQRLDDRSNDMSRAAAMFAERRRALLAALFHRLRSPAQQVAMARGRLQVAAQGLRNAALARTRETRQALDRWTADQRLDKAARHAAGEQIPRLEALGLRLESVSYRNVLARGYAVVRAEGRIVPTAAAARKSKRLHIEFHDGRIDTGPAPRRKTAQRADSEQGVLL